MQSIFGRVLCAIGLFCTLPATVAGGKRAFHKVSRMKDYLSSTVCLYRLNSLTILSIQCRVARKSDFNDTIDYFASMEVLQWALEV